MRLLRETRKGNARIASIALLFSSTTRKKKNTLFILIQCIAMAAHTCSTMILLFNINCHYERYDFTFNIHVNSKNTTNTCQISKKGIHYSSIQGHLLYSHTSPSSMNCFALDEK
ncbi:hypothetical protein T03_1812 [Trichinella britovi]|uniref:Uncharacterized protein n=1 Tax=Trichinella britovi TaxID=45882 RepID=A0A0V1CSQ9_TRIBR|nr:hypothetical protein T03_1812 [Trichinella britovi]